MSKNRSAANLPTLFDHGTSEVDELAAVPDFPSSWLDILRPEFSKTYYRDLARFLKVERSKHQVFPPEEDVFNAFKETPYDHVRVLILGQDPYHDEGQAHGMCFSVRPGVAPPPSLKNIFRELKNDLGCAEPNNGYLLPWARQGVLLLNSVLTVRAHEAGSHQKKGWESFADAVIRGVSTKTDPIVFVLWGNQAQKKIELIQTSATESSPCAGESPGAAGPNAIVSGNHLILKSAHPSPLSANNGFFGSRPFSKINDFLRSHGSPEINWQLPNY